MKLTEVLVKYFGWTEAEANSKERALKNYTVPTEQEVLDRVNAYKIKLNLDDDEFLYILNEFPALLTYESSAIKSKIDDYIKEFNFTQTEFTNIFKKYSRIMSISPKTAKHKAEIYRNAFGFTLDEFKDEFKQIFKERPNIIGSSEDTIILMASKIFNLGITKEDIIANSKILTVPADTLKLKYLILRQVAPKEQILRTDCFTTSPNKTYARLMYLNFHKKDGATLSTLIKSESIFKKIYAVDSGELQRRYKITQEAIKDMLNKLPNGEITFTNEEVNDLVAKCGK